MEVFFQLLITGVMVGSIYALVALGWTLIYKCSGVLNLAMGELTLWSVDEPSADELLSLLTTAGMATGEARAITPHGRRRIFASLCHENRVDILRRLCRLVKRKIEDRTRTPGLHVDCHMLAEESKRLVASSL